MNNREQDLANHEMEREIGVLLKLGVIVAASVVFSGGIVYLFRHGLMPANYKVFQRVPLDLCQVSGILANAISFHGRGLIQLGLLLLIAVPIARVALSIIVFARQRDVLYVFITLIVFLILVHSLLSG